MSNLMSMIGFEYKKIFKRKSFILAVVIMLFMSTFALVIDQYLTTYEMFGESRPVHEVTLEENEMVHKVAGYLDTDMIDAIHKTNAVISSYPEGGQFPRDVYESNVVPYSIQRSILSQFVDPYDYSSEARFSTDAITGDELYAVREKNLIKLAQGGDYSEAEINDLTARNAKLSTPFYFDAFEGYRVMLVLMTTSAVFIVLALAICIAPIFSDEYQKRTDALILASKYGKNSLILAKLITVVSFSLIFVAIALGISAITVFATYGTYGADVSFQFLNTYSVYPLTMLQAMLIYFASVMFAGLFMSGVIALLSAHTNSFTVIVVSMVVLVGSMFVQIPWKSLRILDYFLPAKMMSLDGVFSDRLVSFFGIYIPPYIFIPIVCVALSAILFPLAYRAFKRHQI